MRQMRSCSSIESKKEHEDGIYLVESILAERIVKNQKFYKVRWEGFTPDEDSWEPEDNLSNVRNLIENFHQKSKWKSPFHNNTSSDITNISPILNTSPTHGFISNSVNNKTPLNTEYLKRRMAKSRGGHFEYVPQSELVASKTKYFDDIRDGKIDLSSNDLYSRVKTRRRCLADASSHSLTEEDSLSRPSSLNELADNDLLNSEATLSRYSAPTSPKNLAQSTDGSMDECFSAVSEPFLIESMNQIISIPGDIFSDISTSDYPPLESQSKKTRMIKKSRFSSRINSSMARRRHVKRTRLLRKYRSKQNHFVRITRQEKIVKEGLTPVQSLSKEESVNKVVEAAPTVITNKQDKSVSRDPLENCKIEIKTNSTRKFPDEKVAKISSPIFSPVTVINETKNKIEFILPTREQIVPQQTVHSNRELINHYFDLCQTHSLSLQSNQSWQDDLAVFPILEPIDTSLVISSQTELVTAITQQHWSLLANQPLSNIFSNFPDKYDERLRTWNGDKISYGFPKPISHLQHPLIAAIVGGEGKPFIIHRLLKCGISPDLVDPVSGWPILVIATYFGRIQGVRVLLDAGAQPNASANINGRLKTALGIAITTGDVDMANLLILNGSNFYNVEEDTTALKLIIQLLKAITSTGCDSPLKCQPPNGINHNTATSVTVCGPGYDDDYSFVSNSCVSSLQRRPLNPALMPLIQPPEGIQLPRSLFDHMRPLPTSSEIVKNSTYLLSAASLSRLYELIACHHARLSVAIDSQVRRWLISVGLVQSSLIMPCQWVNVRQASFLLSFATPHNIREPSTDRCVPLLLLIHGSITPPGCYSTWMDDDGPCFVESVVVDGVEQKALGRQSFISTLFPLDRMRSHQSVCVNLTPQNQRMEKFGDEGRNVCIGAIVISVKPLLSRRSPDCIAMPRPKIVPPSSSSYLRQRNP